jgi:stage II sporulation protein D
MSLIIISSNYNFVYAAAQKNNYIDDESLIRVQLVSKFTCRDNIKIENNDINVLLNDGCINLTAQNNFEVKLYGNEFVLNINETYQSYEQAIKKSNQVQSVLNNNNIGSIYRSYIYLDSDNHYSVYITGFNSEREAQNINETYFGGQIVYLKNKCLTLYSDDIIMMMFGNGSNNCDAGATCLIIAPSSEKEFINLDDEIEYRGSISFVIDPNKQGIHAINTLPIKDYVKGVVPCEMPASWHEEALKAQIIAAKTYAAFHKLNNTRSGIFSYDVVDTTQSQVYRGKTCESNSVNKLVDQVKNIFIFHNNKIIEAVYGSSSGGRTENAVNVWGYDIPYLHSVAEINENEESKIAWERKFTFKTIRETLKNKNVSIGQISYIKISGYTNTGRVNEITIVGSEGKYKVLTKDIRQFFSPSLRSNFFRIAIMPKQTSSNNYTTDDNEVIFYGRGWGHAVGMSQYGAKGMAEIGWSFRDILNYYYTDVNIKVVE